MALVWEFLEIYQGALQKFYAFLDATYKTFRKLLS